MSYKTCPTQWSVSDENVLQEGAQNVLGSWLSHVKVCTKDIGSNPNILIFSVDPLGTQTLTIKVAETTSDGDSAFSAAGKVAQETFTLDIFLYKVSS